jgi:hypothetical protein
MPKPAWWLTVGTIAACAFLLGSAFTERVLVTAMSAPPAEQAAASASAAGPAGDGVLRRIARCDGRNERLQLLVRDAPQKPAASSVASRPHDPFNEALGHGIKAIGPHSRTIDRATLTMALANMGQLSLSARIAPELRDGRAAGLRFTSVQAGGAFAQLGFRSGDRIAAINGLALIDAESGLAIYTRLRSARHITVELERDGQPIVEEYDVP